ncbi:response regulator [Belliella kenyensis]|uniref:histidine kinase n=1 Tax=Belliella kenyensis TaxID=1472724 RepID=A0ABV8ESX8_9BACT|nr:response regulator [Belliella kenyensis]MCH7402158.1 response regulator [Belliella kenyensis]MDN3601673.1 response regulator [Belliella kenyensis]
MKKDTQAAYSKTYSEAYRWFVGAGFIVVFLIIFLAYNFFEALSDSQVKAKHQFLSKQVELAAKDVQSQFSMTFDDLMFFVNTIDPNIHVEGSKEQLSLEGRTRRVFNNHRNIVDTLVINFSDRMISYHFDSKNNFIKTLHDQGSIPFWEDSRHIVFGNSINSVSIVAIIDLDRFINNRLGNYYLGLSSEKLLYANGKVIGISDYLSSDDVSLDSKLYSEIDNDIRQGFKGNYQGRIQISESGSTMDALIHQYPFTLYPLTDTLSVIFVQDKAVITSGVIDNYMYLLGILVVLLLIVILTLFRFIKNAEVANQTLSKNSQKISELFRQQNLLLQESRGFIYFQDANRLLTEVSSEVVQILGYDQVDFLKNYRNYFSKEDFEDLDRLINKAIAEQKESISFEFNFQKKNGDWIRARVFERLVYDNSKRFNGIVGICTDIHDKYLAEQEQIRSNQRLKSIMQGLPDNILICDYEGEILDYYVQDQLLFTSPLHTIVGKKMTEVLPESVENLLHKGFETVISTGKLVTLEFETLRQSGKKIFEMRIFKLDDERLISLARNVTGQKLWEKGLQEAMEAAEQANKAKTEFLANMSHEIRTPMNGLLGIISLMENTPLNEQQVKYLRVIRDSGNALTSIINDILDYSKIEAGMMSLDISKFDLKEEVLKILNIFNGLIEEKKIHLRYSFEQFIPKYVQMDKLKLGQILFNLIGNAIKFTPNGGDIIVSVTGEMFLERNVMLNFSIKDSGIGISDDKIQSLKMPFVQADNSNTREYKGTGLGLAISEKLIMLMGGELEIESQLGVGSTFSFSVFGTIWNDQQRVQSEEVTLDFKEDEVKGFDWINMANEYPMSILLVEDNETNLKFMKMLMNELGYDITIAKNGLEGVMAVQEGDFDLIFMDIQMPKMNGLEATAQIRKLEEKSKVPIIGLSANAFHEDINNAISIGMNGYLTKPVQVMEIALTIKKHHELKSKGGTF